MGIKHWILRQLGEAAPCETCEVLKMELALAHSQNTKLLDSIIHIPDKTADSQFIPEAILPKHIPWRVKREELERADRLQAQALREHFTKVETTELEKQLEVSE